MEDAGAILWNPVAVERDRLWRQIYFNQTFSGSQWKMLVSLLETDSYLPFTALKPKLIVVYFRKSRFDNEEIIQTFPV